VIAPDGLPWGRLRQPDRLSCGASALVVARMLADEVYAERVLPRFADEVLATHREVVGWWPRHLGTPPWSLLRHLPGRHRLSRPDFDAMLAAAERDPVAVYVGDRFLPRHVVLVVAAAHGTWVVYDPARGGLVTVDREQHERHLLPFGRWGRAWFVLLPR
jgi:hypothetical protein